MIFTISFLKELPRIKFDIYHSPHDIENVPVMIYSPSIPGGDSNMYDEIPDKYKDGFSPGQFRTNVNAKVDLLRRIFHEEFIKEKKDKYIFENISPEVLERIACDVREIWETKIKIFYVFENDELNIVGF